MDRGSLTKVGASEPASRTVADVKDFDSSSLACDTKDNWINVRLAAVQQMPETSVLWRGGATIRQVAERTDCILQTVIPLARGKRLRCVDIRIEQS